MTRDLPTGSLIPGQSGAPRSMGPYGPMEPAPGIHPGMGMRPAPSRARYTEGGPYAATPMARPPMARPPRRGGYIARFDPRTGAPLATPLRVESHDRLPYENELPAPPGRWAGRWAGPPTAVRHRAVPPPVAASRPATGYFGDPAPPLPTQTGSDLRTAPGMGRDVMWRPHDEISRRSLDDAISAYHPMHGFTSALDTMDDWEEGRELPGRLPPQLETPMEPQSTRMSTGIKSRYRPME